MNGSPDYFGSVIIYGNHDGTKEPLMVDSDGRIIYLSNDWQQYWPTVTGTGGDISPAYSEIYYKRMGGVVFFSGAVWMSGTSGVLTNATITLPVDPSDYAYIQIPARLRTAIKPPDFGFWDEDKVMYSLGSGSNTLRFTADIGINLATHYGVVKIAGEYPV